MKNIINDKKIIIAIVCIIFFAFIAIFVKLNSTEGVDSFMYNLIQKTRNGNYFRYVTELGDTFVYLIIILFVFFTTKKYDITLQVIGNVAGAFIINFIFKNIFMRARPSILASTLEKGFSFPSGHSAVSAAVYIYLLYLILKKCKYTWIKWISVVLLPLLIASIGISRVYLGVHYITDVIAGFLLGISFTMVYIYVTNKYVKKSQSKE